RLPAATVDGLAAVGLRRIRDLHALPRATLAARFGPELLRRLDQAYGRLDEPLSPRLPVPPHSVRLALPEPITTAEAIAEALRRLLASLCAGLENTGEGARRLRLELHRVDRRLEEAPQTLAIGTGHPVRRPDALMRLFAQKLDRVEPGPGLELMVLSATEAGPLAAAQAALDGTTDGGMDGQPELGELMDRLGNRLGERAGPRPGPRPSRRPGPTAAPASRFAPALPGAPGRAREPPPRPPACARCAPAGRVAALPPRPG
ncbi:Y-family DNA polymerase, partial [Azospirillum brasilense]|uniref:Y-family DNA polymerase n=1 Tax=Azospirillum brasilense TaxID=192 RepID=UPI00190C3C72